MKKLLLIVLVAFLSVTFVSAKEKKMSLEAKAGFQAFMGQQLIYVMNDETDYETFVEEGFTLGAQFNYDFNESLGLFALGDLYFPYLRVQDDNSMSQNDVDNWWGLRFAAGANFYFLKNESFEVSLGGGIAFKTLQAEQKIEEIGYTVNIESTSYDFGIALLPAFAFNLSKSLYVKGGLLTDIYLRQWNDIEMDAPFLSYKVDLDGACVSVGFNPYAAFGLRF